MSDSIWKLAAVIGGTAFGLYFLWKIDPKDLKEVANHAIDAFKEYEVARLETTSIPLLRQGA